MEKIKWMEEYLEEALRLAVDEGYEPALKLLGRLLFEEPGYGRLHYVLGKIYLLFADDRKLAALHLRMAIRFDPELAEPYWYLGHLLCEDQKLDKAIRIFRRGMKAAHADKSQLFAQVGRAYELKEKFGKAIRHYKDALRHSAELWDCRVIEENIRRCKRKQK